MNSIKDFLATHVPAPFKDVRMTLDAVLSASSLAPGHAHTAAYAVAVASGSPVLAGALKELLSAGQQEQAEVAAAAMGMTNVFYSYLESAALPELKALPAQIRMVAYGQQAAKDKLGFEVAALAVSIAGKCRPCISSHVQELQKLGLAPEQFRDLGRLAASVSALSKAL